MYRVYKEDLGEIRGWGGGDQGSVELKVAFGSYCFRFSFLVSGLVCEILGLESEASG